MLRQDDFKINIIFGFILMLFVTISCKQNSNTEVKEIKKAQKVKEVKEVKKVKPIKKGKKIYVFENDRFTQTLVISGNIAKTIKFRYESKDKLNNIANSIVGVAKLKVGDFEMDVDETGAGYPVLEYVFVKNRSYIYFRIDYDTKNIVRIIEGGFEKKKCKDCPYPSIGLLRLK